MLKTPRKRAASLDRQTPAKSAKKPKPTPKKVAGHFIKPSTETPLSDVAIRNILSQLEAFLTKEQQKAHLENSLKNYCEPSTRDMTLANGADDSFLSIAFQYTTRNQNHPFFAILENFLEYTTNMRRTKIALHKTHYDEWSIMALQPVMNRASQQPDSQHLKKIIEHIPYHLKNHDAYTALLLNSFHQAMSHQAEGPIKTLLQQLTPGRWLLHIGPYAKQQHIGSFIVALTAFSFENQTQIISKIKQGLSPLTLLKQSPTEKELWKKHNPAAKELIHTISLLDITPNLTQPKDPSSQETLAEINKNRRESILRLREHSKSEDINLFKTYLEFVLLDLIVRSLLDIRAQYLSKKIGNQLNPKKINTIMEDSKSRLMSITTIETVINTAFQTVFLGTPDNALPTIARLLEHTERQKVDTEKDHNKKILSKLFTNTLLAEKVMPDIFKKNIIVLCEQAGIDPKGELNEEKSRKSCTIS